MIDLLLSFDGEEPGAAALAAALDVPLRPTRGIAPRSSTFPSWGAARR